MCSRGLIRSVSFCFGLFALGLIGFGATAAPAQVFELEQGEALRVAWRGQPLILSESLHADPGLLERPEGHRLDRVGEYQVANLWRTQEAHTQVTYRREAASDGKQVEITSHFRVPPWYRPPDGQSNSYSFSVPIRTLEGMTFRAWVGRMGRQGEEPFVGRLSASMPNGPIITRGNGSTTFIAFEDGRGGGLIFDGNPMGVTTFAASGQGSQILGSWQVVKAGDHLRFSFGGRVTIHNGLFTSKMRILEGTLADYHDLHAHHTYTYYGVVDPLIQLSFAPAAGDTPSTLGDWQVAADHPYDATHGFGWRSIGAARTRGDLTRGLLHGSIHAQGEGHLAIDVPQPGIYLFTVRTAIDQDAVGPFTLTVNDQVALTEGRLEPGKVTTLTFSRYLESGSAELVWSGHWAVSTVALQKLIHAYEDFSFKRGVWLASSIPTPSPLFQFEPAMPPAQAAMDVIDWIRSRPTDEAIARAELPPARVVVNDPDDPAIAWRWWGNITSLGPSNYASFLEFETEDQIAQRLDELKALGFRIVLLNGLHFRHSWEDQFDRVRQTIATIVRLGHERGMRVLDHRDLSVAVYQNTGLNVYLNALPQVLRDVRHGQVTRGYCISNPDYRQAFWDHITRWVAETDIDGLMLDEVTFHRAEFCGCQHCRAKFLADTGVSLPVDETLGTLLDVNDPLWKLWLQWRNRQVGDWFVRMLEEIRKVKPAFVLMNYTTHYGMGSSFVARGPGGGLHETARAASFLGTEIMSRNVFIAHRSNFTFRNMIGSLRGTYGVPVFGLVYAMNNPVTAYAGWIMNNMRGQVTWSIIGSRDVERDALRYTGWSDNMDLGQAASAADVALIFSIASRDFPATYGHVDDLTGIGQQLDDAHIPYDILMDLDLDDSRLDRLARYRLVILPSACSLSDTQLAALKTYLRQGGRVLATGHTGSLNERGEYRGDWPVGRWIGLAWNRRVLRAEEGLTLQGRYVEGASLAYPHGLMRVTAASETQVLTTAHQGAAHFPAIAQGDVGSGRLTVMLLRPGAVNNERDISIDRPWVYEHNQAVADFLERVVREHRGPEPAFEAVDIPVAVRLSVYRQPRSEGGKTTLVHLFNASGAKIELGQQVSRTPPENPFPRLERDVVFEIDLPAGSAGRGEIVSPDWPGARPVRMEPVGADRWRVTVGREDLYAYGIVRLW